MPEKPQDPWWIAARKAEEGLKEAAKWWMHPSHQQRRDALRRPETLDSKNLYYTRLAALKHLEDPFLNSDAPENPLILNIDQAKKDEEEKRLQGLYEARLVPYHFAGRPGKADHIDPKNLNVGHKLHLNVGIEEVVAVSEYLKKEGFYHKFLSGGEVTDGTVFTVYVGSKDLTDKLAKQLSEELKSWLRKPVRKDEIEYAPNIPGRFVGDKKDFMQYGIGIRGISVSREMASLFSPWSSKKDLDQKKTLAFQASFNALADKYGEYFYGSN